MKRTRRSAEQVVGTLREADAMLAAGRPIAAVVQALGVSEATSLRRRSQYGEMGASSTRAGIQPGRSLSDHLAL